jgi:RNA recognition motif-containing protein
MTMPVKIFISGYPQNYDELALVQLVSPYGEVSTIKIVRDKQSRKPKGYAFIEMVSRAAAEEVAIALDGLEMKDKSLTVTIVEEKAVAPASNYKKVERPGSLQKNKRPRMSR